MAEITGLRKSKPLLLWKKYPPDLSVTWNIREALKRVKMKKYLGQEFAELEASHRYFRVEYEDFRSDNSIYLKKIFSFLNCDPTLQLASDTQSVIQSSDSNTIDNVDALADSLERHNLRFE